MSQDTWYYAAEGQQHGPISFDNLQNRAQNRWLRSDDLVWSPGMENWQRAGDVLGLLSQTPTDFPPAVSGTSPAKSWNFSPKLAGGALVILAAAVLAAMIGTDGRVPGFGIERPLITLEEAKGILVGQWVQKGEDQHSYDDINFAADTTYSRLSGRSGLQQLEKGKYGLSYVVRLLPADGVSESYKVELNEEYLLLQGLAGSKELYLRCSESKAAQFRESPESLQEAAAKVTDEALANMHHPRRARELKGTWARLQLQHNGADLSGMLRDRGIHFHRDLTFKGDGSLTIIDVAKAEGEFETQRADGKYEIRLVLELRPSGIFSFASWTDVTLSEGSFVVSEGEAERSYAKVDDQQMKQIQEQRQAQFQSLTGFAKSGDKAGLAKLLEENDSLDVNFIDVFGYTALMRASEGGHLDVVDLLLDHGAELDLQGEGEDTALIKAVKNRHIEVVKRLLEAGARLDVRNSRGDTALSFAEGWGRRYTGMAEIADLLRKFEAQ